MAKKSVGKRSLKRAVIYLRVSDPKQVRKGLDPEGISLPTQREACIRKAKELGVLIVDEYVEPGRSATAVAKRPRFREMMQRLRNERDVDHIIAYATSRMYRNWKENGAALLELQELGVTLVSATENIDSATAEGELLEGVYAVLNGFRSRQDGEDVKRKMTHKASQGGTVYRAPIGYLNKRDYSDGRDVRSIIVDPIRGPLIRLAFELFATGHYTYKSLQAKLTEAGLRTRPNGRYGERPISIYRLGTLLQDRYYLGYVLGRQGVPGHPRAADLAGTVRPGTAGIVRRPTLRQARAHPQPLPQGPGVVRPLQAAAHHHARQEPQRRAVLLLPLPGAARSPVRPALPAGGQGRTGRP